MKKEKVIIFAKKELLFPDFWIFKSLNKLYWRINFNLVLKAIKRYKQENLIVISDYPNKVKLKEKGIDSVLFGDYSDKYESRCPDALNLIRKLFTFSPLKELLDYKNINLGFAIEDEYSWELIETIDNLAIIKRIIGKENPSRIVICGRESNFCKCVIATAKDKVNFYGSSQLEYLRFIEKIIKRYSLAVRFHKVPLVNRREFVPINDIILKKIKPRVLILGYDDLHYKWLSNVADEIMRRNKLEVIVLCNDINLQKKLQARGMNVVSYGDFINKDILRSVRIKKSEINKLWKEIKTDEQFISLLKYKDIDIKDILKDDFSYLFSTKFEWVMYYIECIKRLLEELEIDCIISITDVTAHARTAMLMGKIKSIPSLVIKQYVMGDANGRYVIPLISDNIAVWGQGDKDAIENLGEDGDKIHIVGTSRLDFLKEEKDLDKIYDDFGLERKGIIVFATQMADDSYFSIEKEKETLITSLVTAIKQFPDKQLIIKLHSGEPSDMYNSIIKDTNAGNVKIIDEANLADLLRISDMLITITSTSAIEAILLNKPVININLTERPTATRYIESGATLGVFRKEDIAKAINSIYTDKELRKKLERDGRKFIKYSCYKNDGKATDRVVGLIENIIYPL